MSTNIKLEKPSDSDTTAKAIATDTTSHTKPTIKRVTKDPGASSKREDDKDLSHKQTATIPIGNNPALSSLANIKSKLANPKNREIFVTSVVGSLAEFSRRKLNVDETEALSKLIDNELVTRVFRITKLA